MGGHKPNAISGDHRGVLARRVREGGFMLRGLAAELVESGLRADYRWVWTFVHSGVVLVDLTGSRHAVGWTAPRTASAYQDGRCQNPYLKGGRLWAKSIRNLSTVTRVSLDLAKRVFQVQAADAKGEIVAARKLMRNQLIPFFAVPPPCVVAMEAFSSAHHWGRALIGLGHKVRLLLRADDEGRPRLRQADCGIQTWPVFADRVL
jgi:hypothetical protein